MSEIVKTEAVVLNKIDYRDTSVIASLYTEEFGVSILISVLLISHFYRIYRRKFWDY